MRAAGRHIRRFSAAAASAALLVGSLHLLPLPGPRPALEPANAAEGAPAAQWVATDLPAGAIAPVPVPRGPLHRFAHAESESNPASSDSGVSSAATAVGRADTTPVLARRLADGADARSDTQEFAARASRTRGQPSAA